LAHQHPAEAWAELPPRCAHLGRAQLTPMRSLPPFGALTLKVHSVDTLLPLAVASSHSLLVEEGDGEEGE
jgi:hypothetical protein